MQFTVPADLKDPHLEVSHNDLSTYTADGSGTFSSTPRS
jgi:hypothetical protein